MLTVDKADVNRGRLHPADGGAKYRQDAKALKSDATCFKEQYFFAPLWNFASLREVFI